MESRYLCQNRITCWGDNTLELVEEQQNTKHKKKPLAINMEVLPHWPYSPEIALSFFIFTAFPGWEMIYQLWKD